MPATHPFGRLLWLLICVAALTSARAATSGTVVFENSVTPVPAAVPAGVQNPHRPFISRKILQAAEVAADLDFEVTLKMRNFDELQQRVNHGEIIPRPEMAARYFPLAADYQTVATWLTGQGFKIVRQDDNHLAIFVRASVGKIQQALKVNFARVALEGEEFTSATTAPSVPAAVSTLLVGVNGLQPHIRAHKHLIPVAGAAAPVARAAVPAAVKPNSLTSTSPPYLPSQIAQAYHADTLYNSNVTGTGQAVAIVIDTFPATADLQQFWTTFGVTQSLNNIILTKVVTGSTLPAPSGEESLDVEWASSIAPGVQVRVYATSSLSTTFLDQAYQEIYTDVVTHPEYGIHQMSMSFGIGETYTSAAQVSTDSQYFANLASAGVTIFASSGDGGSTPGQGAAGDTTGPVQVENPASDPNVAGVGGTSLLLDSNGNTSSETTWNLSGGGTSIYFGRPTWQIGSGFPTGPARCVPDVSSVADQNTGAYVILNGAQVVYGGTSWSSPTWAAYCALINQARANVNLPSLGLLGPKIYGFLGTSDFNDITSGSNSNQTGVGYSAGPGYDLTTGIGSPSMQNLAQALIGVQTTPPAQTVPPAQNASFAVASNTPVTSYQWQRLPIGNTLWSNLSDDSTYSGTATATLTIASATPAMSGDQFRCVLGTTAGSITTAPSSVLIVDSPLVVNTLAGKALTQGSLNGIGTAARFAVPSGVAVDGSGNIYVADFSNDTIREVTPTGTVTTPYGKAGRATFLNGKGTSARFNTPNGVAIDASGNLYVADSGNDIIRKIDTSENVTTFAGQVGVTGTADGTGTGAQFNNPQAVAVDASGNVYVADTSNQTVRKITSLGVVTTIAGTAGTNGYADGNGTAAIFNSPASVAVDSSGNVYVADLFNFVVRKIDASGNVTTPYGQPGQPGRLDGIGNGARFNAPIGLAMDSSNNLYITDSQIPPQLTQTTFSTSSGNNMVRRVNTAGVVSTIAGSGVEGSADGTGSAAQFYSLQAVALNSNGVAYFADSFNQTIRVGGIKPVIATQLGTQTVTTGQSVTFSVTASGPGPFTFQWYMNGNLISGATSSSYTIASAASGSAGTYDVIVTDTFGSTTSSTYSLTVSAPVPAMPRWAWAALPLLLLVVASRSLKPAARR